MGGVRHLGTNHNETCFGGGSGVLIPFRKRSSGTSQTPSTPPQSEAPDPMQPAIDAIEAWGRAEAAKYSKAPSESTENEPTDR